MIKRNKMNSKRLITVFLISFLSLNAYSWSSKEHRLMAYIAEEHLTKSTRVILAHYLNHSIVEYSTWMDRVRKSPEYKHTTFWHSATMAEDGSFPEDGKGKAIPALNNAIKILENYREYDDSTVFVNILYVIHLVPEIHCPSHCFYYDLGDPKTADSRFHQKVYFDGKIKKYHSVWDSSISTLYPGLTLDEYKDKFDNWSPTMQRSISDGTPEDWMRDIASICRKIYDLAEPDTKIGIDFLRLHKDIPESMVPRAAYRLARVLNDIFDKEQPSR